MLDSPVMAEGLRLFAGPHSVALIVIYSDGIIMGVQLNLPLMMGELKHTRIYKLERNLRGDRSTLLLAPVN